MRQNILTNVWFYWGLGHFEVSQSVSLRDTLAKKPNKTGLNAAQNGTLWDSLGQFGTKMGQFGVISGIFEALFPAKTSKMGRFLTKKKQF